MGIKNYFDNKLKDIFSKKRIDMSQLTSGSLLTANNFVSDFYYRYLGTGRGIHNKFRDLVAMSKESIIANALEMFVDDATQYSPLTQKRIWAGIDNKKQNKMVQDLFDDQNIDENTWYVNSVLGMYGSQLMRVYYGDDKKFTGGVVNIEFEENLFRYIPIEINGVLAKWIDKYTNSILESYEVIPGRINMLNPNSTYFDDYYDISFNRSGQTKTEDKQIIKNTFKYGTSLFDNSLRLWKQLTLLEDTMLLTRLDRSPILRLYKVRVDGMTPKTASDMITYYSGLLTSQERVLSVNDELLSGDSSQLSFGSNIMLPVEDKGDIEVDEVGGLETVTAIADIDYFKKKFFASLKVPSEFLGLEDNRGFNIGESSLLRKEINYSKRVKKLQFACIEMFKKLAYYHLLSLGETIEYDEVNVVMNIVSSAEDEEFKSALDTSIDNATSFIELINDVKEFIADNNLDDKTRNQLTDYLTTKILNINDFNWSDFFKDLTVVKPEDIIDEPVDENLDEEALTESKKLMTRKLLTERVKRISYVKKIMEKVKMFYKQNKIDLDIKYIPKFSEDKTLKYIKQCFTKETGNKKYLIEDVKQKKLLLEQIGELVKRDVRGFDVAIFSLKFEYKNLDINKYKVTETKQEKININNLIFTDNLFEISHIVNSVDREIKVYELENKYYCNYSNGCKIFKSILEDKTKDVECIIFSLKSNVKR